MERNTKNLCLLLKAEEQLTAASISLAANSFFPVTAPIGNTRKGKKVVRLHAKSIETLDHVGPELAIVLVSTRCRSQDVGHGGVHQGSHCCWVIKSGWFQFIPKCWTGLISGVVHSQLGNLFLLDWLHQCVVLLKQEMCNTNVLPNLGIHGCWTKCW